MVRRDAPVDGHMVHAVHTALRHRGPDATGEFAADRVWLGSQRLAIIDTEGGRQPLGNPDGTVTVVANGEIYNHVELRAELLGRGHVFATASDCEVIVHLYEELGERCVDRLRGMFAFAVWDARRERLFLARDRMGEKPLYLYVGDGALLFASELKALLAGGLVPFELDADAANLFFHYQYVPEPRTIVRGVEKLPPAHTLTVDLVPWRITRRRYWAMEEAPPIEEAPATALGRELGDVARLVSRSDVPVGIGLSGGIDSALLAALLARELPGAVHAFTVGYAGRPANDERADARALAEWLGIPFHDVELDARRAVGLFPTVVHACDDPIADMSSFGYYAVARLARENGVPVLVQGQGSDELFWGYPWLRAALAESNRLAARWTAPYGGVRTPPPGRRPARRLWFYQEHPDFRQAEQEHAALYPDRFAARLDPEAPYRAFTREPPWGRLDVELTRLICDSYLLENGLAQGDRLAMANSVELRVPFVDHRFVETVIGLRKAAPDHEGVPKKRLRDAAAGLLPPALVDRPKRPFEVPMEAWHRALFDAYGPLLRDGVLVGQGLLRGEAARALAAGPRPTGSGAPLSFKALVLEMWCRTMTGCLDPAAGNGRHPAWTEESGCE